MEYQESVRKYWKLKPEIAVVEPNVNNAFLSLKSNRKRESALINEMAEKKTDIRVMGFNWPSETDQR